MTEPKAINVLLLACFIVCILALCAHGASSQANDSGGYPMDGSGAVNAVRLRKGGSIPSPATDVPTQALASLSTSEHPPGSAPAKPLSPAPISHGQALHDELMRVFVSEAGWYARRTHLAMAHVLGRTARNRGLDLMDVIADRIWRHNRDLQRRPWLTHLTASCDEPQGFPGRWSQYGKRCRFVEQTAYAFLYGRTWNPCAKTRPTGWRSYGEPLERAIAKGFEQVDCAGNQVAFVRVKGRT